MAGLTIKQEKFCQGLFSGLTQREAYKQAFSSSRMKDKTIDETASRLAKERKVTARIDELTKEVADRNMITAEWVLKRLKDISDRCMTAEPVMVFDRELKEMVETGEYKFDSSGANKATELIGKHLKLFTDNVNLSGSVAVQILDDID